MKRRTFLGAALAAPLAAGIRVADAEERSGSRAAAGLEVVVCGAGAFGAWTALDLARRGARVTLADGWGPGNSRASSGDETRVIRAGYELLHLITFFTVGPKEARAWTVEKGSKAPRAAGEIHTDFERGFIRAETIAYDDYIALNGEAGARDAGKLRQEGKDYVVKDGDVLHFKFNV